MSSTSNPGKRKLRSISFSSGRIGQADLAWSKVSFMSFLHALGMHLIICNHWAKPMTVNLNQKTMKPNAILEVLFCLFQLGTMPKRKTPNPADPNQVVVADLAAWFRISVLFLMVSVKVVEVSFYPIISSLVDTGGPYHKTLQANLLLRSRLHVWQRLELCRQPRLF
jgi:hypothetical protein